MTFKLNKSPYDRENLYDPAEGFEKVDEISDFNK